MIGWFAQPHGLPNHNLPLAQFRSAKPSIGQQHVCPSHLSTRSVARIFFLYHSSLTWKVYWLSTEGSEYYTRLLVARSTTVVLSSCHWSPSICQSSVVCLVPLDQATYHHSCVIWWRHRLESEGHRSLFFWSWGSMPPTMLSTPLAMFRSKLVSLYLFPLRRDLRI